MFNKIIKYSLLLSVLLLNINFSNEFSVENIIINNGQSDECGLMTTTENSAGIMVNPLDASICQEDLSMIVLYFIFGSVLDGLMIIDDLINVPEGVRTMAQTAGVGEPMMMIFRIVSLLTFSIGSIVILINVVRGITSSSKEGKFLGERWDNSKVITRIGSTFILLAPAGTLSLVQIIVLITAVFSSIGGNFIWGNYLNFIQVKSTEIQVSDIRESQYALDFSSALIENEVCVNRTRKKIFNDRFANMTRDYDKRVASGNIFADAFQAASNFFGGRDDLSLRDRLDRYEHCMAPANIVETETIIGSGGDNIIALYRGNYEECRADTYSYKREWYGEDYNCGGITYNYSRLDDELVNNVDRSSRVQARNIITQAATNLKGNLNNFQDYNSVKSLESNIRTMFENNRQLDLLAPDLVAEYEPIIESLKDKIQRAIVERTQDNQIFRNNVELKQETHYLYHQYVLNYLLGGMYESEVEERDRPARPNAHTLRNFNNLVETERPIDYESGFFNDILKSFIIPAANNIEEAHCAEHWGQMRASRRSVKQMNENMDSTSLGDLEVMMECVAIEKNGDDYTARYHTIDNQYINADIDRDTIDDSDILEVARQYHERVIRNSSLNEAKIRKYNLALWVYVAKQAVTASISELNKEAADEILPATIRQQGWGGAGSYMLRISINQQNAASSYDKLNNNISWTAEISEANSNYIHPNPFSSRDFEESDEENSVRFRNMNLNDFVFNSKFRSENESSTLVNEDPGHMEEILRRIENFLTSPMDYLKLMASDSTDNTLREIVRDCSTEGTCKIGDVHPLNALMQFGHESVKIAIGFMIADIISDGLMVFADGGSGGVVSNAVQGVLSATPLGKILTVAIQAVNVVIGMLMPFIYLLLFVGILFAYIIPTIPYIAFTIVFINWVILIITSMIVLPIFFILFASTDEQGNSKANLTQFWQTLAQIFLKPAFLIIGLIAGWSLASISIYIINMTAFASGIGSTLSGDRNVVGASLSGLIDILMFYAVYIIIITIVLNHSYKIIYLLPEQLFKRLGIQDTQDTQILNELQFERMIQTAMTQDAIKNTYTTVKQKQNERIEELKEKRKRQQAQDNEGDVPSRE